MRIFRPFLSLAAVTVVLVLSACGSIFGSDTVQPAAPATYSLLKVNGRSPSQAAAEGTLASVVRNSELKLAPDGAYVWRSTVEARSGDTVATRFEVFEGRYDVSKWAVVLIDQALGARVELRRVGERLRYVDAMGTVYEFERAFVLH